MSRPPWWWHKLKPRAIWGTTRLVNEAGGLRVTSAWRSWLTQLRLTGGSKTSTHPLGWSTDLAGSRQAMERGASLAREWGARQVLIHDAGSGLHLHVDWRGSFPLLDWSGKGG